MADFYDINFALYADNLLNPLHKAQPNLDFITSITQNLQYLRDNLLGEYKNGAAYPQYNALTVYGKNDRITFTDKGVYLSKKAGNVGNLPAGSVTSENNWLKIQDVYIGSDERLKYNGQICVLSRSINKWFDMNSAPYMYIVNNNAAGLGFTLWVPLAKFNSLGATTLDRRNRIFQFMDLYSLSGIVTDIQTF